jgi:hypothetical protein
VQQPDNRAGYGARDKHSQCPERLVDIQRAVAVRLTIIGAYSRMGRAVFALPFIEIVCKARYRLTIPLRW